MVELLGFIRDSEWPSFLARITIIGNSVQPVRLSGGSAADSSGIRRRNPPCWPASSQSWPTSTLQAPLAVIGMVVITVTIATGPRPLRGRPADEELVFGRDRKRRCDSGQGSRFLHHIETRGMLLHANGFSAPPGSAATPVGPKPAISSAVAATPRMLRPVKIPSIARQFTVRPTVVTHDYMYHQQQHVERARRREILEGTWPIPAQR